MAVIFEDDFSYGTGTTSPGVEWDQTKWTTSLVGDANSGAFNSYGRMNGTGTGSYIGQTAKITARTGDFEVLYRFQKSVTGNKTSVQMQGSGTISYNATYGYVFNNGYVLYNDTTTLRVAKLTAGVGANIVTTVGTYAASTWYNIRWKKVGTTHSTKIWADGASEPSTWTTGTEAVGALSAGVPHLGSRGAMSSYWSDFTVDDLQVSNVNGGYNAEVSTASVTAPDATVSFATHAVIGYPTVHSMDATSVWKGGTVSAQRQVSFDAPVLTSTASIVSPTVTGSAAFTAQAAVATAALMEPGLRKDDGFEATPALASVLSPNASVKTSINYATTFAEYPLGALTGWTMVTGGGAVIQESASALSGQWLYLGHAPVNTAYTFDAVPASDKGNVVLRMYNNGGVLFGPYSFTLETGASPTLFLSHESYGAFTQVPVTANSTGLNYMRVDVSGGYMRARVWPSGDVEPSTWDINYQASMDAGLWGIKAYLGRSSALDYFAINTDGSAETYNSGKEIDAVALTADATIVEPTVIAGTAVTVNADVATAQATLVEPGVETTDAVTVSGGPATATAEMLDARVISPDVTVAPDAFEAQASMPDATGIGGHDEVVTVEVMTASADMTEPEFSNITNINIAAVAAKATATTPAGADSVYDGGNVEIRLTRYSYNTDPFINTIKAEFGTNAGVYDKWFRFGQQDDGPLKNYATNTLEGEWIGVPEFGVRDDYERPATSFAGDSYALVEHGENTDARRAITWEAVFRTSTDGPISSADNPVVGAYSGLEVIGGRLTVIATVNGTQRSFPALGRVDDGKWHHVLVTIGNRGLEMWIDGVSRLVRRVGTFNASTSSVPQVAVPVERIGTNTARSTQFAGDILMFAQYGRELSKEAAGNHYYAYVLATVIRANAMTASATAGNNKGRGNKKRALMLYSTGGRQYLGDTNPEPNFAYFRIWAADAYGDRHFNETPFDHGAFTVYPRRMELKRNEYDLTPELFTMDDVPDLEDYDAFFYLDTPLPNSILDDTETTGRKYNMQPEYEKFINATRRACDTGIAFWCMQPQLALDLGFVDRIEIESIRQEAYDVKSYNEEFPPFKATLGRDRTFYFDTHYLNQYRVTAQLPGFTDLGGHIIKDVVYWYNFGNPFSIRPDYIKWNAKAVPDGLALGETVYFPTPLAFLEGSEPTPPWSRESVYSVPEGAYRGTAVAKQQATINMGGTEVANPHASNALTIVLQPGDNVKGRPIGGKVLIDFMSAYPMDRHDGSQGEAQTIAEWRKVQVQLRPYGTPDYPTLDEFDGYDYDSRRMNAYFEWRQIKSTRTQRTDTGDEESGTTSFTREITTEVPFYTESEKYPVMYHRQYPWLERALNWLSISEEVPDGSAKVIAARSEASAAMPTATVTVQKHDTVNAAPAVALATIVKPAGISEPDVVVTTLPMTAQAQMLNTAAAVRSTVLAAHAEMPEPTVTATGADFVLTVRAVTQATLYLKEDAVV